MKRLDAAKLERLGRLLCGPLWQSELARTMGVSSLCHSGPQSNRPKRSNLSASSRFILSLPTAGRD